MQASPHNQPTLRLCADDAALAQAAQLLRAGQQVAFPTETVYGLGGNAMDDAAVAGIYAAKARPSFNPLIVHIADLDDVNAFAVLDGDSRALAAAFWPGPLTLVLPLRGGARVSKLVTAGLETVAVRLPAHPVARALIRAAGVPLAAPSANPSGRVSPTTAQHVLQGLDGRIAAVVDGGPSGVGVESTIIMATPEGPVLLRAGGVTPQDVASVVGLLPHAPVVADSARPAAPGQLLSHYAPKGTVRLNALAPKAGETMLGFGEISGDLTLSAAGDLREAAANLFACLHQLDATGATAIAVAPIPDEGLGLAINDRLRRAAAPR
ncbi:L-threonylcarbamoyladenylate synthase [Ketogulonicigenium robustum]|uniref:Threonylcarbamoyl-AMP synthase n=1 Tax=Ketogulonicigenium robustum TaxID=92947 RepID=A0A1W6NX74_9RHOB|nr:L-threonylcarbamoyladenylate synthase [Ketogulonicigenium robustum]ARO13743.1 L-threonylcarbamoyladenylate synthase [Ketogulonicigenium robustum]